MSRWEQEEAEKKAYEKHMQAVYDEQQRLQQCAEEDAWLRAEVERLKAENEVLRGERAAVVAWLRREMQPCSGPVRSTLAWAANGIECGEHRREEER